MIQIGKISDIFTSVIGKLSDNFTILIDILSIFTQIRSEMRRKIFTGLLQHWPKKEFTILTGPRQAGKTTLLKELEKELKSKGEPTLFINLENKMILEELNKSPLNLLTFIPQTERKVTVFIDEVQYLADPSNFLKLIYDDHQDRIKIICSGSSAFYLDGKFKDSLAGRKRIFRIYTCDFEEYLAIKEKFELVEELSKIENQPTFRSIHLELLQIEWEEYMVYGGYPAVISEPDKREKIEVLREIRDSFVKRDITDAGVKNEELFYQLFKLLAAQSGQLVNINELSNTLRARNETIQSYLEILKKCFHLAIVKPFYANLRKELTKMPKAYLLDSGLRNCLINNFQHVNLRIDKGELWELMVYRVLLEKFGEDTIRFWRTSDGKEVDFVLPEIDLPLAIEAKVSKELIKPKKYAYFQEHYSNFDFRYATFSELSEDFFRVFL